MTFAATILTLYPEMFPGPLGISLAGRALEEGKWSLDLVQIRDFAADKHRTVDDTPAGGGAGMVLRADVLAAAVDYAVGCPAGKPSPLLGRGLGEGAASTPSDGPHSPTAIGVTRLQSPPEGERESVPILAMTPRGKPLTQARVRQLSAGPGVIILCGRFEGFDERIFAARDIEEVAGREDALVKTLKPPAQDDHAWARRKRTYPRLSERRAARGHGEHWTILPGPGRGPA